MGHRITAKHLPELYSEAARRFGSLPAFATRKKEMEWEPVSYEELYQQGLNLAASLMDLGVDAREHVGLFADNRYEWILADYGVQLCGAVDVPRGRDITEAELIYIINHAGIKVAFAETKALLRKIESVRADTPKLKEIILMDPEAEAPEGIHHIHDLVKKGGARRKEDPAVEASLKTRVDAIRPDDLFTLIYTSGTTGKPKGVMLTHGNITSQVAVIPVDLDCTDRVLSILPVWHIFERVFEVFTIACGVCTYYTNIRYLGDDLRDVEPTFMGSAPRLWESLHERILKRVREAHWMRRLLFHTGYFLSIQYNNSLYFLFGRELHLKPASLLRRILLTPLHALRWLIVVPFYGFFNVAVLEPIRLSAGGSLKATISGGGALPAEIDRFFNYIGIPVLEGYGMTETAPVIAVRLEDHLVIGTVGPPIEHTEVRIVDLESGEVIYPNEARPHQGRGIRGEICVKGPQVMKGYYRDEEQTAATIQDGWLRTGDLGMITFNDCLKILGRSKATIVLLSGENLEPAPIEMRLTQSLLIEHCMVVGQDKKHVGLLVVPSLEGFREKGFEETTLKELVANPDVKKMIRAEIKKMITVAGGFKPFELVKDFRLLDRGFKVGEELTSLQKMKRHVITDKYEALIEEMYENDSSKGG
ncbi:MAG: long-chain fatty acid--CoA ligase [Balneolaceae bacterium]|nr:MAG: long-chain fatty acid--CoA ligase [Balneolaceae bacterium]